MILTDEKIRDAVAAGEVKIEPFEPRQVQAASYDFRVGDEAVTTSTPEVRKLREKGFITLEPGDFGFVTTREKIELSDRYAARFGLRSGFARKGLSATTGPQIDPGFRGVLIIGLTNLTPNPVTLSYEDDFVTVEFHELPEPSREPYDGPYQDVTGLRPQDIALVTEKQGMALSEMMNALASLSSNVAALTSDINMLKWVIGIGLTILAIIIALS